MGFRQFQGKSSSSLWTAWSLMREAAQVVSYEVPLGLVDHGLDKLIVRKLGVGLKAGLAELDNWRRILHVLRNPKTEISIAVVGKYAEHKDAYKSIYEALDHAGIHHECQVRVGRIQSEEIEREGAPKLLAGSFLVVLFAGQSRMCRPASDMNILPVARRDAADLGRYCP